MQKALNEFLIETGIENEDFEGIGNNDLIDYLKLISAYRTVLNELKKRFNVLTAIRYMIENPDAISNEFSELFEVIKAELESQNYNILNSYISEDEIRVYVQTPNGLEELIINDSLFVNPLYIEAVHIYSKMKERDIDLPGDPLEVLENIEKSAKKGAFCRIFCSIIIFRCTFLRNPRKIFGAKEKVSFLCIALSYLFIKNITIMAEIEARVKAIIVDKLGVDESEVTPNASFTNDLGADSLDTVELIMELEKEFGMSIPDDQAEKIATVQDAVDYIANNAK